jgi:hypothetical protein
MDNLHHFIFNLPAKEYDFYLLLTCTLFSQRLHLFLIEVLLKSGHINCSTPSNNLYCLVVLCLKIPASPNWDHREIFLLKIEPSSMTPIETRRQLMNE